MMMIMIIIIIIIYQNDFLPFLMVKAATLRPEFSLNTRYLLRTQISSFLRAKCIFVLFRVLIYIAII